MQQTRTPMSNVGVGASGSDSPPPGMAGPGSGSRNLLSWWHGLAAPPEPAATAPFAERERARRGRLASTILLGLLVLTIILLPIGLSDRATLYAVLFSLVAVLIATALNRRGHVALAGGLLVLVIDLALMMVLLGAPHGQLDLIYVPVFDLFVLSELIAATVLPPSALFLVALANSAIIFLDTQFQPPTPAFHALLGTADGYTVLARPIVLQLIVAIVAFLWTRSALQALVRADQAELVAELERREVENKRELEEGVRELLAAHVQISNGNFNVRVPTVRNSMLWQIGSSLNNLISRFGRMAQADFVLRRTQDESHRLAEAIRVMRSGRQPIWPAPSGTPVDELLEALGVSASRPMSEPPRPLPPAPPAGTSPASFPPLAPGSQHWPQAAAPSAPLAEGELDLPDWLRPEPLVTSLPPQPAPGFAQAPQLPSAQGNWTEGEWPDLGDTGVVPWNRR